MASYGYYEPCLAWHRGVRLNAPTNALCFRGRGKLSLTLRQACPECIEGLRVNGIIPPTPGAQQSVLPPLGGGSLPRRVFDLEGEGRGLIYTSTLTLPLKGEGTTNRVFRGMCPLARSESPLETGGGLGALAGSAFQAWWTLKK